MLDKYLKIFGLDNNYSLEELEDNYKRLLKEFDTKNIEDDLKVIFLEEQVKIREAHQILLKHYHKQEKVGQIKSGNKLSSQKVRNKKKKQKQGILVFSLLILVALGLLFQDSIDSFITEWNPFKIINNEKNKNQKVKGCIDKRYQEFNPLATVDDGSCVNLHIFGCIDKRYQEYNPLATVDDSSCVNLHIFGCIDKRYQEYNPLATVDDGSCVNLHIFGCIDKAYEEYNRQATKDDGSCKTKKKEEEEFKVGDWVVFVLDKSKKLYKLISINGRNFEVEYQDKPWAYEDKDVIRKATQKEIDELF
jgi:hypothetical protein